MALHPNDARRVSYVQARWSRTANTLHCNAPTQRKEFKQEEEIQTSALRNQAVPFKAIGSLIFCRFQTSNSRNISTRVDPFGNNQFLGSEGGRRGRRDENEVAVQRDGEDAAQP